VSTAICCDLRPEICHYIFRSCYELAHVRWVRSARDATPVDGSFQVSGSRACLDASVYWTGVPKDEYISSNFQVRYCDAIGVRSDVSDDSKPNFEGRHPVLEPVILPDFVELSGNARVIAASALRQYLALVASVFCPSCRRGSVRLRLPRGPIFQVREGCWAKQVRGSTKVCLSGKRSGGSKTPLIPFATLWYRCLSGHQDFGSPRLRVFFFRLSSWPKEISSIPAFRIQSSPRLHTSSHMIMLFW
jgi:hypothetical protein